MLFSSYLIKKEFPSKFLQNDNSFKIPSFCQKILKKGKILQSGSAGDQTDAKVVLVLPLFFCHFRFTILNMETLFTLQVATMRLHQICLRQWLLHQIQKQSRKYISYFEHLLRKRLIISSNLDGRQAYILWYPVGIQIKYR